MGILPALLTGQIDGNSHATKKNKACIATTFQAGPETDKLGEKTREIMANNDYKEPEKVRLVVNELLCYCMEHMQSCTKEQIIKTVYDFYDIEEILIAKHIVYDIFPENGEFSQRKTSNNRSEKYAHTEDIIDSLIKVDSEVNVITFVAQKIKRIPKWDPNVADHFSLAEKLSVLEGKMNSLEFVVSENKANLIETCDKVTKVNNRLEDAETQIAQISVKTSSWADRVVANGMARRQSQAKTPLQMPGIVVSGNRRAGPANRHAGAQSPSVGNRRDVQPVRGGDAQHADLTRRPGGSVTGQDKGDGADGAAGRRDDAERPEPDQVGSTVDDNSESDEDDASSQYENTGDASNEAQGVSTEGPEDGFKLGRHERRRIAREQRRVVRGRVQNARLRGGPPDVRSFFLYRVNKSYGANDVKEHLDEVNVQYVSVQKISNPDAFYCSFKIEVPACMEETIMDGNIWPEGIRIREFQRRNFNYGRRD